MSNEPKDLMTIKEFAALTGIEQTTLRYWDEIGLFSPAKRNRENKYRYYSPHQAIAAKFVTVLSDLDIPLKTIGMLAKERTPEKIVQLIERKQKLLDLELQRLRESYSVIHTRLDLINHGIRVARGYALSGGLTDTERTAAAEADESQICVLHREAHAYILGPPTEFKKEGEFLEPFIAFCRQAVEMRINLNYPVGGFHESFAAFQKAPGQPDSFFSLDPTGNRTQEAGEYLTGYARGYYGEAGNLAERLTAYAAENALTVAGPVYTVYLHDEICVTDPKQFLMQIYAAVKK